ncbi:MAG: Restriction endonuclease [uncultured bacterium]|nr:MAG: Restriction endonuclease [uncultured bacterium]
MRSHTSNDMQRAFLTRSPNAAELSLLQKYLACYRDGSGNHREEDGTSRADSRQIERCFAELLHGTTTENKMYYDFVVEFNQDGGVAVRGASIKTKELTRLRTYPQNRDGLRAHMEVSNSSAKDWALCAERGLAEDDFRAHRRAAEFGQVIMDRQRIERQTSERAYLDAMPGNGQKRFEERDCVFISLLYSPAERGERVYLVSAFSIVLPEPASWYFRNKALIGADADGGVLYEWYALSGSQFKYYPKLASRLNGTELFTIPRPTTESLRAKATRLFGD